jgi:hypothetical protein
MIRWLALALLLPMAASAQIVCTQTNWWQGTNNADWRTPANWSAGIAPTATAHFAWVAAITNGNSGTGAGNWNVGGLSIVKTQAVTIAGPSSIITSGAVYISGGTLTMSSPVIVPRLTNGAVVLDYRDWFEATNAAINFRGIYHTESSGVRTQDIGSLAAQLKDVTFTGGWTAYSNLTTYWIATNAVFPKAHLVRIYPATACEIDIRYTTNAPGVFTVAANSTVKYTDSLPVVGGGLEGFAANCSIILSNSPGPWHVVHRTQATGTLTSNNGLIISNAGAHAHTLGPNVSVGTLTVLTGGSGAAHNTVHPGANVYGAVVAWGNRVTFSSALDVTGPITSDTTTLTFLGTTTASAITNNGSLILSNSSIYASNIVSTGTVTPQTSTIYLLGGTSNLTNYHSLVPVGSTTLTNAAISITGTLSSQQGASVNAAGGTLTLSNPGLVDGNLQSATVTGNVLRVDGIADKSSGQLNTPRQGRR